MSTNKIRLKELNESYEFLAERVLDKTVDKNVLVNIRIIAQAIKRRRIAILLKMLLENEIPGVVELTINNNMSLPRVFTPEEIEEIQRNDKLNHIIMLENRIYS